MKWDVKGPRRVGSQWVVRKGRQWGGGAVNWCGWDYLRPAS